MVRHKRRRWACADCGSTINDESMRETARYGFTLDEVPGYAEFCNVCCNYDPEVVMKYD